MAPITVVVKHQGKRYDVEVDPGSTGEDFKLQLFSLTDVEPDMQKVLIKGGQLKNDADMGKLGLKKGQIIMMMGTVASKHLVRPKEQIRFVEDMSEAEMAKQMDATPAGLTNLGNTCYLNSTLQTLRSIPELQATLARYPKSPVSSMMASTAEGRIANQLSSLFGNLGETQDCMSPTNFLFTLRSVLPQFAEKSRTNDGYAQQDAEEAWSQIIQHIDRNLITDKPGDDNQVSFVTKYMSGQFASHMACDEEAARDGGEEPIESNDKFFKLDCHIDASTNHLRDGILAGLSQKIEKQSQVLGRDAVYTKTSTIARAPKYLTVHFVRFFWKREAKVKAKIMRKVSFPQELDIVEFCSPELKRVLIPVRDKVREIRKDQEDIERARKRLKKTHGEMAADIPGAAALPPEKNRKAKGADGKDKQRSASADGDTVMEERYKTDAEFEAEKDASLAQAKKELMQLVDEKLHSDQGSNQTGLYELRGVVTHQGASADSGHYTAYVKKSAPVDPKTGKVGTEDGMWWWFNDDKVTEVKADKVEALAGGGESHSALILLYKAVPLPEVAASSD
ncbi:hypothetical protein CDD81_717 [Ophiocordyceps australis]|uniref:Ubiquitin carboxyl-terminal hydrolase n=1 Tax=Ophiocordyceps australis TaxID=1399860 RepID=A0A2C5X8F4_9HYPO|nr:hypothetical protein CDD81_717 [Ophiocordyceps australis]